MFHDPSQGRILLFHRRRAVYRSGFPDAHIGSDTEPKEGNVLFNDALNTFYLRLYSIGRMVKDHSDQERNYIVATI